ncbi:DUF1990 family protein [Cellulomonas massiliensis]|uniref:DUF1990 family protein n=1 Tax=Cellulomonas massiliensis TaxID=1465811 RepID=UPI0003197DFE|nr:DUF1990 domain-containing protein [Cellulomonas massiliensis]
MRIGPGLAAASAAGEHPSAALLAAPPPGFRVLSAATPLPGGSPRAVGEALTTWRLHRLAGLRVDADGPARAGSTVVSELAVGPLVLAAPCRVLEVVRSDDVVALVYASLPGHPEHGVERFAVERGPDGLVFRVTAVSRPGRWFVRAGGPVARAVQARVTERYLAAALHVAHAG